MKYLSGLYTDVGIKKSTNQDSMLLLQAQTPFGEILFAMVCDGMGGLKKGEVASAEVVQAFRSWFAANIGYCIDSNGVLDAGRLNREWMELIQHMDDQISRYGVESGFNLGTTMVCLLLYGGKYYAANIGDSRAYLLSDQTYQITHDHTVVQREIDMGTMTLEQSMKDPRRSILLQCIGASDYVEPDFFMGDVTANQCYLLCCDGFRHVVTPEELYGQLGPGAITDEQVIEPRLRRLTEEIKNRGETDNISGLLIRIC